MRTRPAGSTGSKPRTPRARSSAAERRARGAEQVEARPSAGRSAATVALASRVGAPVPCRNQARRAVIPGAGTFGKAARPARQRARRGEPRRRRRTSTDASCSAGCGRVGRDAHGASAAASAAGRIRRLPRAHARARCGRPRCRVRSREPFEPLTLVSLAVASPAAARDKPVERRGVSRVQLDRACGTRRRRG